ncbi:MAG: anti-sigma factor [Planctomycetaceae bacterium]
MATGALGVSAVCLLLASGFFLVPRPGRLAPTGRVQRIGGLSCYEVDAQLDAYVAGTLDAETMHKIDTHVAQCRYCRDCLQQLRDQAQQPPATAGKPPRSLHRILVSQSL